VEALTALVNKLSSGFLMIVGSAAKGGVFFAGELNGTFIIG
jgi:hypothetical protein